MLRVFTGLGVLAVSAAGDVFPVPTRSQLAWSKNPISAQISWDIVVMCPAYESNRNVFVLTHNDDPAQSLNATVPLPPASAFNATDLDPENWVVAAKAAGAKTVVFVAMHSSGFAQWPSTVYDYSVTQSIEAGALRNGTSPIEAFITACKKHEVNPGLYVTWNYNYRYNVGSSKTGPYVKPGPLQPGQLRVTQAEYEAVQMGVLREVYCDLPSTRGALTEIWFDGGDQGNAAVHALWDECQPQAVIVAGSGKGQSNVRNGGSEAGFVAYPWWSNANLTTEGTQTPIPGETAGGPFGRAFVPTEGDMTVTWPKSWFWTPTTGYNTLRQLAQFFTNTVGRNANLLLGLVPDDRGRIPADQAARVAAFGAWHARCYASNETLAAASGPTASDEVEVSLPVSSLDPETSVVDRVVLREDLTGGAQVLSYEVFVKPQGYYTPYVSAGGGSSVGASRIHFLQTGPVLAEKVKVVATRIRQAAGPVVWASVEVRELCELN